MAQIILIDIGTFIEGINKVGDVVGIYEDDVVLGSSYSTFTVVKIPFISAIDVEKQLIFGRFDKKYTYNLSLTEDEVSKLNKVETSELQKKQIIADGCVDIKK